MKNENFYYAILNTTGLTKLMLVIADPGEPLMTDVVFENVFKEMSLREFYIRSIGPVESVRVLICNMQFLLQYTLEVI